MTTSSHASKVRECFTALDRSISAASSAEFERLSEGMTGEEQASRIVGALKQLKELQSPRGEPPKYDDPWVTLLYVLWYQPGQTYLAYRIIRELAGRRRPQQLRVMDIGCGALATELAIDIAIACGAFPGNGVALPVPVVYSHDSSSSMVSMGESISEALLSDSDFSNGSPSEFSKRVLVEDDLTSLPSNSSHEEWWVTALHAVYQSNRPEIRAHLNEVSRKVKPECFVLTTHSSKQRILPKPNGTEVIAPIDLPLAGIVDRRFISRASRIADFRRELRKIVQNAEDRLPDAEAAKMAKNYLARSPGWFASVDAASCVAYERRE